SALLPQERRDGRESAERAEKPGADVHRRGGTENAHHVEEARRPAEVPDEQRRAGHCSARGDDAGALAKRPKLWTAEATRRHAQRSARSGQTAHVEIGRDRPFPDRLLEHREPVIGVAIGGAFGALLRLRHGPRALPRRLPHVLVRALAGEKAERLVDVAAVAVAIAARRKVPFHLTPPSPPRRRARPLRPPLRRARPSSAEPSWSAPPGRAAGCRPPACRRAERRR